MFCPKCGQQQASDGVRFCSRCGFQLEVVKELLATDGAPLAWPLAETHTPQRSARNRGIRQGVMLMLLTAFIVPSTALLARLGILPKELIALAAIICAVGGFMRLAYALILEDGAQSAKPASPVYNATTATPPAYFSAGATPSALPPAQQQHIPARDFGKQRKETAEMSQPPSVTENTTRLLDNANDN